MNIFCVHIYDMENDIFVVLCRAHYVYFLQDFPLLYCLNTKYMCVNISFLCVHVSIYLRVKYVCVCVRARTCVNFQPFNGGLEIGTIKQAKKHLKIYKHIILVLYSLSAKF